MSSINHPTYLSLVQLPHGILKSLKDVHLLKGTDWSGIIQGEELYDLRFSNLVLSRSITKTCSVVYQPFYICIANGELGYFPNFDNFGVSLKINETTSVRYQNYHVHHLEYSTIITLIDPEVRCNTEDESRILIPSFSFFDKTKNLRSICVTFNNMGFKLILPVISMSSISFKRLPRPKLSKLYEYLLNEIGKISKINIPFLLEKSIKLEKPRFQAPFTHSHSIQQPPLELSPEKRKAEAGLEDNQPTKKPRIDVLPSFSELSRKVIL